MSEENIKSCKSSIKKKPNDKHLNILTSLREQMSGKYKRLNNIAQEQGSSSWLSVLSIKQLGFSLSTYKIQLPSHCGCLKFT